jgi:hypothetical protein
LRWLLVAVTIVAVLLGLAAIVPAFVRLVGLAVYLLYPTPLLVAAIFARGEIRAFSVGAMIPWAVIWSDGPPHSVDWGDLFGLIIWLVFFGGACGIVAAVSYRWLERHGGTDSK